LIGDDQDAGVLGQGQKFCTQSVQKTGLNVDGIPAGAKFNRESVHDRFLLVLMDLGVADAFGNDGPYPEAAACRRRIDASGVQDTQI
jgi:hypothetical protein